MPKAKKCRNATSTNDSESLISDSADPHRRSNNADAEWKRASDCNGPRRPGSALLRVRGLLQVPVHGIFQLILLLYNLKRTSFLFPQVDDLLLAASTAATVFNVLVIFCGFKLFKRNGDTMHIFIINMTLGDLLLTGIFSLKKMKKMLPKNKIFEIPKNMHKTAQKSLKILKIQLFFQCFATQTNSLFGNMRSFGTSDSVPSSTTAIGWVWRFPAFR